MGALTILSSLHSSPLTMMKSFKQTFHKSVSVKHLQQWVEEESPTAEYSCSDSGEFSLLATPQRQQVRIEENWKVHEECPQVPQCNT